MSEMNPAAAEKQSSVRRSQLTGLLVRDSFLVKATEKLNQTAEEAYCLLALDIQHFKVFKSWFGQDKGDQVLAKIGEMLHAWEVAEDTFAGYFGRDSFAILLPYNEALIEKLYAEVRSVIQAYTSSVGFLPAVGIYLLEEKQQITLETYDMACMAVEEAKESYSNRIRFFDSKAYNEKKREYELLEKFQEALNHHEISFYLQPQCRISSGKIVGAEALARWFGDNGEVIVPGSFVPFLEQNGLITELDKCVWEAVCGWIHDRLKAGKPMVPVSINVSRVDLLSMDIAKVLGELTEKYKIPPSMLKVEITESAYADDIGTMNEKIAALKEKGFHVFMDDFGSGYSSLNMLDKVNVDLLKLDMAFMRKDTSLSQKGISIVESVFSMAKALDIPVIVEGVENEEQVLFLKNLGARYAQGYHFYRPMPIEAYEALIDGEGMLDHRGFAARSTEIFHSREFLNENLFSDAVLNNILGPVAFYSLEGKDLTITRFNEPFYRAIGDESMESRQEAIQNYVVKEDWPALYRALEEAEEKISTGGMCDARFYKSDGSVFWFQLHFFYLRKDDEGRKIFYGQVEDITEAREQGVRFFEVLREQSNITMRLNLDQGTITYVAGDDTLYKVDLPSIELEESVRRTVENRIETEEDKQAFISFFDVERLKEAYQKAIYHEKLTLSFKLIDHFEPVEFSTYYIRYSKAQGLLVYAFAKALHGNSEKIEKLKINHQ